MSEYNVFCSKTRMSRVHKTNLRYAFMMRETPIGHVCMICGCTFISKGTHGNTILEQHFRKAHADFEKKYPFGSDARKSEADQMANIYELALERAKPSTSIDQIGRFSEDDIAKASKTLSRVCAKRPAEDEEFFKSLMLDCVEGLLCNGKVKDNLLQAMSKIKVSRLKEKSVEINKQDDDIIVLEEASIINPRDPLEAKVIKVKPIMGKTLINNIKPPASPIISKITKKVSVIGSSQITASPVKEITVPSLITSQITKSSCYSLMIDKSESNGQTVLVLFIRLVYPSGHSEERFVQPFVPGHASNLVARIGTWMSQIKLNYNKLAYVTINRNWEKSYEFMHHWKINNKMPKVSWFFCAAAEALKSMAPISMEFTAKTIDQVLQYIVKNKAENQELYEALVLPVNHLLGKGIAKKVAADEVCWYKYRKILLPFLNNLPEIKSSINPNQYIELYNNISNPRLPQNVAFLTDFSVDFGQLMNELRRTGRAVWDQVKLLMDFRDKIEIWILDFQVGEVGLSFPNLKKVIDDTEDKCNDTFLGVYIEKLRCVQSMLEKVIFSNPEVMSFRNLSRELFTLPKINRQELVMTLRGSSNVDARALFNEIVALSNDTKCYLIAQCGGDVWKNINEYPLLKHIYERLFSIFSTTYLN